LHEGKGSNGLDRKRLAGGNELFSEYIGVMERLARDCRSYGTLREGYLPRDGIWIDELGRKTGRIIRFMNDACLP